MDDAFERRSAERRVSMTARVARSKAEAEIVARSIDDGLSLTNAPRPFGASIDLLRALNEHKYFRVNGKATT